MYLKYACFDVSSKKTFYFGLGPMHLGVDNVSVWIGGLHKLFVWMCTGCAMLYSYILGTLEF